MKKKLDNNFGTNEKITDAFYIIIWDYSGGRILPGSNLGHWTDWYWGPRLQPGKIAAVTVYVSKFPSSFVSILTF